MKMIEVSWIGSHTDEEKLTKVLLIHLLERMVYLQHKSYLIGTSRIRSRPTVGYFELKGSEEANKQASTNREKIVQLNMQKLGSKVAIQNSKTKPWNICSTVTYMDTQSMIPMAKDVIKYTVAEFQCFPMCCISTSIPEAKPQEVTHS